MIPELDDGVLPEEVHRCTLEELDNVFGVFRSSDRRPELMKKLRSYMDDARSVENVKAVVINGSFVTAKEAPGDIDLLLVLKREVDLAEDLRPAEYKIQSKSMVRRLYGFDIFTGVDGSIAYDGIVSFLVNVNPLEAQRYTRKLRKGILRIEL
jgi:dihydrodipicolinate synthase/N-acetylneuraminate lyase